MNKAKRKIFKVFWLLAWLCTVPIASCSFDEEYESCDDSEVTLQIGITAREEGELNTRPGYEEGQNSEYMHNLCVLLVSNNTVVKKLLPDLQSNIAAMSGNLRAWNSKPFTVMPGTYTVYAFANINTYYSGLWGSLTGIQENDDISSLNIDRLIIDNPASKLDFVDYFIPMSAKKTVTVTPATKSISIGLDRMVSKIRMSITGKPGANVKELTFGGYADKVTLFQDAALSGESYGTVRNIQLPADASTIDAQGRLLVSDFYVNASPAGHSFAVSISTDEISGVTYKAMTARNELPRNSIFPLTLQLNEYGLDLAARCWVSPIGSLPVEVSVSGFDNTYMIEIPEGCQFEFTVNGISGSAAADNLSCIWNIQDGISGMVFDGPTTGVTSVRGHVTAAAGKTFELSLLVTWTDGAASYNRTYTVKVLTKDITEFPFKTGRGGAEFTLDLLLPEMINIFIK